MATLLAVVIAAALLLFVFSKLQGARAKLRPEGEEVTPKKGRRQRKLDEIRANDPPFEPKSAFDVMLEEVADLGLDDVPGGQGIDAPVRLKVWKRDAAVRASCNDSVRFVVHNRVEPEAAKVDDVRLECNTGADTPDAADTTTIGSGAVTGEDGNRATPTHTEAPDGAEPGS